jgi:CHAT domain-containing protein
MTHPTLSSAQVDALVAADSKQAYTDVLLSANLFNAAGLEAVLAHSQATLARDPSISRRLAVICTELAEDLAAPNILPAALYLRAQTHAMNGEFGPARDLIEQAQQAFQRLGNEREALRTNLGLMNVLAEGGNHAEAITVGQRVLSALANQEQTPEQITLAARVQTNLGVCYEMMGQYEEALAAYAVAEAHYTSLGMDERTANVSNNRGIALLYLGRVRESIALFEYAATLRERAELPLLHAQSLANLGEAHLLLGNYDQALSNLTHAERLLQAFPAAADLLIVTRKMADTYLAINLIDEAADLYRQAEELARSLQMDHQRAWVLWGWGAALMRMAQHDEAASALRQAAELLEAADNRPLLSSVRLEQAALLAALNELTSARQLAADAQALVAESPWRVQQIYAALRLADLSWPNLDAVEALLAAVADRVEQLDLPHLRYRLAGRLGRLRLAQGRIDEAERALHTAVEIIESMRGTLTQEALRTSFLQDKLTAYEDLLRLYLDRNTPADWEAAFLVAEQARSRALVDRLQGAVQNRPDGDDEMSPRLAALRADLDALYNRLLTGDEGSVRHGLAPTQVSRLESEVRRLRLRASMTATPSAKTVSAALRLLERLPPTPLVAYYVLDDEIGAFLVDRGQVQILRRLASVDAIRSLIQRLDVQWTRFQARADFVQHHLPRLEQSVQRILGMLYQQLWAPLEPLFAQEATRVNGPIDVVVAPYGLLHQIPFHALHDGADYLIARYALSYAPSATVYALCQAQTARPRHRALVLGVADEQTPFMRVEAQRVADEFPQARLLIDDEATPAALRAALPAVDVVHLACHGLFRVDNPAFSALRLADGWLTAFDLLDYDFDDTLVVLSACESGRSQALPGDELMGLPRVLIGAGATTVVVSQWLVQDDVTADLMSDFYRHLRDGCSPAIALHSAQVALCQQRSHPYFWAPFVVMGAR